MEKVKKGVRLENISKIYQDPKTGKDFYAVQPARARPSTRPMPTQCRSTVSPQAVA